MKVFQLIRLARTVDLHYSAVDYTLRALPAQSIDDAPARKANIRRRLQKLIDQVGANDGEKERQDDQRRWWQRGGGVTPDALSTRREDGSLELLGTCPSCATKVPVTVPAWMATGGATNKKTDPSTWEELTVGAVVGLAVMIKQSPIPLIIGGFFSIIMQGVLYLDNRFFLHQRALLFLGGLIEALVVLDRELGILRRFGELAHKLWEIGISAMLAFAKGTSDLARLSTRRSSKLTLIRTAEGYQHPPQYHQQRSEAPLVPFSGSSSTSNLVGGPSSAPPPFYFSSSPSSSNLRSDSSSHNKRASWHGNSLAPPPSSSHAGSLKKAASTDGLYGASAAQAALGQQMQAGYERSLVGANGGQQPDSDGEGSSTTSGRKRNESWASSAAGKALSLVPGRR